MACTIKYESDDIIAKIINRQAGNLNMKPLTGDDIHMLRDLYTSDDEALSNFIVNSEDEVEKALQIYQELIRRQTEKRGKNFEERSKKFFNQFYENVNKNYKKLRKIFNARTLNLRINLVANLVSEAIDEINNDLIASGQNALPRDVILNGFVSGGVKFYGQKYILQKAFGKLFLRYEQLEEEYDFMEDNEDAIKQQYRQEILKSWRAGNVVFDEKKLNERVDEQYEDHLNYLAEESNRLYAILSNFGSIASLAKGILTDREGLIMSVDDNRTFSEEASENLYGENNMSEIFDREESTKEAWMEENDKKSAFASLGASTRRILSSIPIGRDDLGYTIYADPVMLHGTLIEALHGMENTDEMMRTLDSMAREDQTYGIIYDTLEANPEMKTLFFVDMTKDLQPYKIFTMKIKNGIYKITSKILNDDGNSLIAEVKDRIARGGRVGKSKYQLWLDKGSSNWDSSNGIPAFVTYLKDKFNIKNQQSGQTASIIANNQKSEYYKSRKKDKADIIENICSALGFNISSKDAMVIASSPTLSRRFVKAAKDLGTFLGKKSETDKSFWEVLQSTSGAEGIKFGKRSLEEIGKVIVSASSSSRETRVMAFDKKGNRCQMFSLVTPSYLGTFVKKIQKFVKNNDHAGLEKFIREEYLDSKMFEDNGMIYNKWLRDIITLCQSGADLRSSWLNDFDFTKVLGLNKSSFENASHRDHALMSINDYFSFQLTGRGVKVASYHVFILGDSNVYKTINGPRYDENTIIDEMWNLWQYERERQKTVKAVNDKMDENGYSHIEFFGKSDEKCTMLPFFDKKFKDKQGRIGYYAKLIEGKEYDEEAVKKAVKEYLDDSFKSFMKELEDDGLLERRSQESGGNGEYLYLDNIAGSNKDKKEETLNKNLRDYFVNTMFATKMQIQLMTYDTAFYKHTKEFQKRFKEIHAPGSILDINAIDKSTGQRVSDGIERVVYFKDINLDASEAAPEFMAVIENVFGKDSDVYKAYKEVTVTDGQGYRSLKSYRKVMIMAGQWYTNPAFEEAYNKIVEYQEKAKIGPLSKEEIKELTQLAVVFQPIKPYVFTHEKFRISEDNVLNIPVQHKYAEAVLIPELLPEGQLKNLALYMEEEEKDIDVVCSTKCVKVGAWGEVDISEAKTKEQIAEAIEGDPNDKASKKAAIHQIAYKDYRIQNNVPNHIYDSRLFATQPRKLFLSGLVQHDEHGNVVDVDKSSYIDGQKIRLASDEEPVKLTAYNLMRLYNSIIVSNQVEDEQRLEKVVDDPNLLSRALTNNVISNNRSSLEEIIAYSVTDGKFEMPLIDPIIEHNSIGFILSLFKKSVNKQKILGGAAVQVSDFGITKKETDERLAWVCADENGEIIRITQKDTPEERERKLKRAKNVLYAEGEIPFDLKYKDANGVDVELEFSDYCNEDGSLIRDKDGVSKLEKEFPGILDIIALRVPTEKAYSMTSLKIVRFSKKQEGGTIRVPFQGTKIAGFDFDIDKLYLMRKEFVERRPYMQRIKLPKEKKIAILDKIREMYPDKNFIVESTFSEDGYTDDEKNQIWAHVYEKHQTVKTMLQNTRRLSGDVTFIKRANKKGEVEEIPQYKYPLNHYFSSATWMLEEAKKNGYKSVEDFKNALFKEAVEELGINGTATIVKGKTLTINRQAIEAEGLKVSQLFEAAANELGFDLSEEKAPKERFHVYDPNKAPYENNRVSRNNMLIQLFQKRLADPDTLGDRLIPQGFDKARRTARIAREMIFANDYDKEHVLINPDGTVNWKVINERANDENNDPEPDYDFSDPSTEFYYNQQNQIAGKLIGAFANQNANYAISTLLKRMELKDPVRFCGHKYSDLIHSPEGRDGSDTLAEFLAASVDAVKDPVLNYLNLNNTTAAAGCLLARLGYTTDEISLLLNQPAIKQVCSIAQNDKCGIDVAVEQVLSRYVPENMKAEEFASKDLTEDVLGRGIILGNKNNSSFNKDQAAALLLFREISKHAQEVSSYLQTTKFTAANSVKSTMGGMIAKQLSMDRYFNRGEESNLIIEASDALDDPITPFDISGDLSVENEVLRVRNNPFAFEQSMYDMERRFLKKIGKYFPYETNQYQELIFMFQECSRRGALDEKTINDFMRDYIVYALESTILNGETLIEIDSGKFITAREYYRSQFINDLMNFIDTKSNDKSGFIANNALLAHLTPIIFTSTKKGQTIEHRALAAKVPLSQFDRSERTQMMLDWESLMHLDKIESKTVDKKTLNEILTELKDNKDLSKEVRKYAYGLTTEDILNLIKEIEYEQEKGKTNGEENEIVNEIKDYIKDNFNLLTNKDKEDRELALHLFKHAFYTYGFDFNHNSFMHMSSIALRNSIFIELEGENGETKRLTYADVLQQIQGGNLTVNLRAFFSQFIANHSTNENIVFVARNKKVKDFINAHTTVDRQRVNSFTITLSELVKAKDVPPQNFILKSEKIIDSEGNPKTVSTFVAAINIDGVIYVADGKEGGLMPYQSTDDQMTYRRLEVAGAEGYNVSYHSANETDAIDSRFLPKIKDESQDGGDKESKDNGDIDPTNVFDDNEITALISSDADSIDQETLATSGLSGEQVIDIIVKRLEAAGREYSNTVIDENGMQLDIHEKLSDGRTALDIRRELTKEALLKHSNKDIASTFIEIRDEVRNRKANQNQTLDEKGNTTSCC